jgi:glucosamine kinase
MQALQHYLWHLDGRSTTSTLIEALHDRIGSSVSDIQHWTTQSNSSVLAQLAPIVFEHAANGDALAQSVLEEAAVQCMNLVRLAPNDLPVYVVGGVGEQLRSLLHNDLQGRLQKARGDALRGLWQLSQQSNGNSSL